MYKSIAVEYSPRADKMAQIIESKANEMLDEGYELVDVAVMPSARAVLTFKKVESK